MAFKQEAGQGKLSESKFYEEGGKKPKHWGDILLSQELIDKIIANGYVMPISGWDKAGDDWKFISLAVDTWKLDNKKQDGFDQAQKIIDEQPSDVPF